MYSEQNLSQGEQIIIKAKFNIASIVFSWIITVVLWIFVIINLVEANKVTYSSFGIYNIPKPSPTAIFSQVVLGPLFVITLIFTITAIVRTVGFCKQELVLTNKKLVGKIGVINTNSIDAPLNKIQNVSLSSGLIGKLFGYGTIKLMTAGGGFKFKYVKDVEYVKSMIMEQIDLYEKQESIHRAEEMARAMSMAQNINNKS